MLALVSALGLGAGGLAFGFLLTLVAALVLLATGQELTPTLQLVLSLVFVQGVGCAGVAFAYLRARPRLGAQVRSLVGLDGEGGEFSIPAAVPDVRDIAVVVAGYLAAFAGIGVGSALLSLLAPDIQTGRNQVADIALEQPEVLLILIPASFLIIGPGEELLFRGVVQGRLREVFSTPVAVGTASVVFAGLHWFALTGGSVAGNLAALGILLVPAVVLGVSYQYSGNIVVPSLIHGAYNATLFTLLYVSIAYGDLAGEAPTVLAALP